MTELLGAGDGGHVPVGSGPTEEVAQGGNTFVNALQYELVADKLVSLLNFEDMKALSTVSTLCLQAVRKTKEFADRARLLVCKEVISLGLLKESTYQWKHISLDLSLPIEVVGLIEDILETATSLVLRLPSDVEDSDLVLYLEEIFKKTKQLQTLDLDVAILSKVLHDAFSNVGVQSLLSKLQCLDIHGYPAKPMSVCYIDGADIDSESPFQRNFLQLSMVPLNLTKFVFGKVIPITGSEKDHVKFIPRIVEATKETLEDLELHLNIWKYEEMKGIRCPKLKRLTISAYGQDEDTRIVQTFIKNQPPLEELVLEIKEAFPVSILLVLQGMLSKMKKLHIKAKRFSGVGEPIDWSFLENLGELRDFAIRKPFGWDNNSTVELYGYGEDFLKRLPSTVEKISLEGFDTFWREDLPNNEKNIGELLQRFRNLKELNLTRSCDAVTDAGLQSLVTNCPNLVGLEFSHCFELGNFGITGIRENQADGDVASDGVSLSNLKGLKHLRIRSCPNITPESILSVAKYRHLRSFDYYKNIELPKEFLFEIVKQNPCLETVAIHIRSFDNHPDHLAALRKEVKAINPRVHKLSILEQLNWEDEDSDSDASSMRDRDGDSDFSGGGYGGRHFEVDYDFDDEYDDESPYFDEDEDGEGFDF